MAVNPAEYFSADYHDARERFLAAAENAGLRLVRFRVPYEDNPELFLDFAFVKRDPTKLLAHFTGVHGIEGFLGSAVQTAILRESGLHGTASLLFVHVVNPYGMLYARRANGNNVDLNRNFERKRRPNPDYAYFHPYLRPRAPWQFLTGFLSAAWHYRRLGAARGAQAIASGQDTHPDGMFYMGRGVEREVALVQEVLRSHFSEVREAVVLDVHTGLGEYRGELLFVDEDVDPAAPEIFGRAFGRPVTVADPGAGLYINQGRFSNSVREALAAAQVHYALQEFGTFTFRRMLNALRYENFEWHLRGKSAPPSEGVRRRMLEAFCPEDPEWREHALRLGVQRWEQALAYFREKTG